MATKSHNIRIDEQIKSEATAIFADLGLTLSDGVNVFLRKVIAVRGFPFPVQKERSRTGQDGALKKFMALIDTPSAPRETCKFDREDINDRDAERRAAAFDGFLAWADANPVFEKGFRFDREATHER
jgi:DNA-damage-inducible protein J